MSTVEQLQLTPYDFYNPPIISKRNPTTKDRPGLGSIWVNKLSNDAWILTSVVNNVATWVGVGGGNS